MNIKKIIITEVEGITNATILVRIFDFLQLVKFNTKAKDAHHHPVSRFADCMNDADVKEMRETIDWEFSS